MALDGTYAGLLASIADWLNRRDLTSQIPDFVIIGEAMNNRELRTVQMEVFADGTSSDGLVAVPSDWLETRTFRLEDPTAGMQILEYVGEEEFDRLEASGLTNTTRYYTILNGAFQVLPVPTATVSYDLRYYAKIPALSVSNTSNWLLLKSPDLYLFSSLLGATVYLKDDDRLTVWAGARNAIVEAMKLESERAKRPATRLRTMMSTFG